MSEPTQTTGEHAGLSEAAIRELLAAGAAARGSVPLDQLWIRVDGESARPQPTGDGGVCVVTSELNDFVEISALSGDRRVPLVNFSLLNELRSSSLWGRFTRRRTLTVHIEGGRKVSVTIRPTRGPDGSPAYELVARARSSASRLAGLTTLPLWQPAGIAALVVGVFALFLFTVWKDSDSLQSPPQSETDLITDKRATPSPTTIAKPTPSADSSPTPGASPQETQQVEATPEQSPIPPHSVEVINDAQLAVRMAGRGSVQGLDALPPDVSAEVYAALKNPGSFSVDPRRSPPARRFTLMGDSEGETFKLKHPLGIVVREQKPTLTWEGLSEPGQHEYSVVIRDLDTDNVVEFTEAPVRGTSWSPTRPLPRGKSYGWFVSTSKAGETVYAPAAGMGTFRVLDEDAERLLNSAGVAAPRSLLVRAIILYRVGLVREASEAFSQLERINPNSRTVKALRKRVEQSGVSK